MPKPFATLIFASTLSILLAHPAHASLFTTAVSDESARELKHIGVASQLGHRLQGQQVGLTVFGNRHFDADVPDWTLDADVRKLVLEEIQASGRLTATLDSWDDAPEGDKKTLLAAAQEKGFDAVLVVEKTENFQDRLMPIGPSLLHKQALGLNRVHPCNEMKLEMWRVADGKRIAFEVPNDCDYTKQLPPAQAWHESWADYSDDDKRLVLEALSAHVRKQVLGVLAAINLQRR